MKPNLLLPQFAAELAYESGYDARYNITPPPTLPAVRLGESGQPQRNSQAGQWYQSE